MASLNRAEIIGNLGAEPDLRTTDGGKGQMVCTLSVATNESWTDKESGEKKTDTEWHRVVLWRGLAKVAGEYLRKGSRVFIAGKLKTRKWTDKDGVDRYTTEIVARDMIMLDQRESSGRAPHPADDAGQEPPENHAPDHEDSDLPF